MAFTPTLKKVPRRSTRIPAQIALRVVSLDPSVECDEHCQTVVVNTEGCGVRLGRELKPGAAVQLEELPGGHQARARVASCAPLGSDGLYWLVGIGLEHPGNVWGIEPAPADWAVAPPAPEPVTDPVQKTGQWPYTMFTNKGEAHPGRK